MKDAYLLGGGSIVGIKTYKDYQFFNVKSKKKVWEFEQTLELDKEEKKEGEEEEK